jgi:hypothetical protein
MCKMKRAREDEPESTAVRGSGDAHVVVAAVSGESSSGAPAAPRRAVTVADSTVPVVVAIEDEMEDLVAPTADLQNEHAGQVFVVPDDDFYAGYDPDSIKYMVEVDRKEAE